MHDLNSGWGMPKRSSGALQGQPKNTNLAIPQNYTFSLRRSPNFTYFVQGVQLPELGGDALEANYIFGPKYKAPAAGAKWSNFTVTYLLSENMMNYYEIIQWMREASAYRTFDGVKPISEVFDEAYLIFHTNKKVPYQKITFRNIFPVELSGLEFAYSDTENKPMTATCKFAITDYVVENL